MRSTRSCVSLHRIRRYPCPRQQTPGIARAKLRPAPPCRSKSPARISATGPNPGSKQIFEGANPPLSIPTTRVNLPAVRPKSYRRCHHRLGVDLFFPFFPERLSSRVVRVDPTSHGWPKSCRSKADPAAANRSTPSMKVTKWRANVAISAGGGLRITDCRLSGISILKEIHSSRPGARVRAALPAR